MVATLLHRGRLLKPVTFDEDDNLINWTESKSMPGSTIESIFGTPEHPRVTDEDWTVFHTYTDEATIGTWKIASKFKDGKRGYMGYSQDLDLLPTDDSVLTGSWALCVDTGDIYFYHVENRTWELQ